MFHKHSNDSRGKMSREIIPGGWFCGATGLNRGAKGFTGTRENMNATSAPSLVGFAVEKLLEYETAEYQNLDSTRQFPLGDFEIRGRSI